jgi:aspartate beta-hydroxylase
MENIENSSKTEEIEFDSQEKKLFTKLNEIFQDHLLSELQSLAAFKFIKDKFLNKETKDAENLKQWVLMKINNKKAPHDKWQLGCPDIVPGLSIRNFWEPKSFEWVNELVKNFEIIKEELTNLREGSGFQPYKSPKYASDLKAKDGLGSYANDKGNWNVYYLFLHNVKFEENCTKCPKTVEIIENLVPRQY